MITPATTRCRYHRASFATSLAAAAAATCFLAVAAHFGRHGHHHPSSFWVHSFQPPSSPFSARRGRISSRSSSASSSAMPRFVATSRSPPPAVGTDPLESDNDDDGGYGGAATGTATHQKTKSPLSMTIAELSSHLNGRGRALCAWDCYRAGIDPLAYYDDAERVPDEALDASVVAVTGNNILEPTTRADIRANHLPVKRRTEGMGREALGLLSRLYGGAEGDGGEDTSSGGRAGVEGSIGTLSHVSVSSDGTTKLLIRMVADGLEVETVIIPWEERNRSTLCVSSQVGCRQGCTFCATGRMGKLRSLTSDEILCQVWHARRVCRSLGISAVDNVVFMGMGEPADNADAVVDAADALADRNRFGMAQSKVTVSTVGPDPDSFRTLAAAPAVLAWSVHATRDELRRQLVPTTKHTMEQLRRGFVDALLERPRKLRTTMLEVALIEDVNDGVEEAAHLADFARRIADDVPGAKVVVNLIPFNDIGHATYGKPSPERVRAFQNRLMEEGVLVYVRTTRGDDESAACGQLATRKKTRDREEEGTALTV